MHVFLAGHTPVIVVNPISARVGADFTRLFLILLSSRLFVIIPFDDLNRCIVSFRLPKLWHFLALVLNVNSGFFHLRRKSVWWTNGANTLPQSVWSECLLCSDSMGFWWAALLTQLAAAMVHYFSALPQDRLALRWRLPDLSPTEHELLKITLSKLSFLLVMWWSHPYLFFLVGLFSRERTSFISTTWIDCTNQTRPHVFWWDLLFTREH